MRLKILVAATAALSFALSPAAMAQSAPEAQPAPGAQSRQPAGQSAAPTVRSVNVVDVSEIPAEARPQVDAAAAKATPENLQNLRTSIDKSPEITKALAAKGAKSSDVIVANLDQQGTLTLVTKKRA